MQSDNRTVGEILNDPDENPIEEGDQDEPALDAVAEPIAPGTFVPQPATMEAALNYAASIDKRREEAHIPPHFSIKELVGITFVVVDKVRQKAALPDTGEMRNGYQCLCAFVETRQPFTVWVGQVALMSDLDRVALPFRATIIKKGRTYQFS